MNSIVVHELSCPSCGRTLRRDDMQDGLIECRACRRFWEVHRCTGGVST